MPSLESHFLETASSLTPALSSTASSPVSVVRVTPDPSAPLGWTAHPDGQIEDKEPMRRGESVILDFGGHRAGHFECDVLGVAWGSRNPDAPARLRLVFGEVLNDVAESFEPYSGWLSQSWLPDEVMNIDYFPAHIRLPRRYAFRYVKIEVIATSLRYGVKFTNCLAHSITSAPLDELPLLEFDSFKADVQLTPSDKVKLRKIDEVAVKTLRNCMQTVYEDGPRRDQRLWIGDLCLQARTAYVLFQSHSLAKRCLYLFAGLPMDEGGVVCASVYEKPEPRPGGGCIVDYSIIFTLTLRDYVKSSQDLDTAKELYPVAVRQLEFALTYVNDKYLYVIPPTAADSHVFHFIDWEDRLDRTTAMQAVTILGLQSLIDLSSLLKLPTPELQTSFATSIPASSLIERLIAASRESQFDATLGVFVSGPSRQVSWGSQAWAVLAGIPSDPNIARECLIRVYEDPNAIGGRTPYLHHYYCEALIKAGLQAKAIDHIKHYWGSMVDAGAETFFEAWDPKEPNFSPYGDFHVNSFCHAWSCTPSLLLRMMK